MRRPAKQGFIESLQASRASSNYGKFIDNPANIDKGVRYPTTVLRFKRGRGNGQGQHPTQKPIKLCKYLIRTYTEPGMTVLDCTMGSGTTVLAALEDGRRAIGIERDPTYFATAQRRIEEHLSTRQPPDLPESGN